MPEQSNEELRKEALMESKRFLVFLVTTGTLAVINLAVPFVPVLDQIPREAVQNFSLSLVGLAGSWIVGRSLRNKAQ